LFNYFPAFSGILPDVLFEYPFCNGSKRAAQVVPRGQKQVAGLLHFFDLKI